MTDKRWKARARSLPRAPWDAAPARRSIWPKGDWQLSRVRQARPSSRVSPPIHDAIGDFAAIRRRDHSEHKAELTAGRPV
jgi:hypothetical protein